MLKNIAEYCKICPICQKVRIHHYKPYKNLFSIPSNNVEPFITVTLDFITDMPPARNLYTEKTYDAILILMNKLIKHTTYINTNKTLNAKSLADLI